MKRSFLTLILAGFATAAFAGPHMVAEASYNQKPDPTLKLAASNGIMQADEDSFKHTGEQDVDLSLDAAKISEEKTVINFSFKNHKDGSVILSRFYTFLGSYSEVCDGVRGRTALLYKEVSDKLSNH
jgi:hypothetical protein